MRPDFLRRFLAMVDELRRHPRVSVARLCVAPPVDDATVQRVHAQLGFSLAERLLAFYRQADGLSFEWVPKEHPGFDPASHAVEVSEPFDLVPQELLGGAIHIYPLEALLDDFEDVVWFESMAGRGVTYEDSARDLLSFSKAVRPFDYFSEPSMAAFFVGDREPMPPVLLGEDHGASFTQHPPTDFVRYMEAMLAFRCSALGRERLFARGAGPWPEAPEVWAELAPSIDALIEHCLDRAREADASLGFGREDFGVGELDDDLDEGQGAVDDDELDDED
jgi:hypothetical protein